MNPLLVVMLAIISVVLVFWLLHYLRTLPERRENAERLRREFLLYEERLEAEKVKQNARVAGAIARAKIDRIASISKANISKE